MPPSEPGSNGNDRDVLTSLPRTRPARRSAKRDRPARGGTPPAAPEAASASDTPARAKATAASKPKPSAERTKRTAGAGAGTRTAKAKAPSARAKATSASGGTARKRPAARTSARTTPATAERPAETAIPPAGYATSSAGSHGPDPFAVVSTAFQAAGEIAQIGATLWSQAVRSAFGRFPKP